MLGEFKMCIAIFSSRTNTLMMHSQFKSFGINCRIINMPTQLGSSCAVCIEFSKCDLNKVQYIINRSNSNCLVNIYAVKIINNCKKYVVIV